MYLAGYLASWGSGGGPARGGAWVVWSGPILNEKRGPGGPVHSYISNSTLFRGATRGPRAPLGRGWAGGGCGAPAPAGEGRSQQPCGAWLPGTKRTERAPPPSALAHGAAVHYCTCFELQHVCFASQHVCCVSQRMHFVLQHVRFVLQHVLMFRVKCARNDARHPHKPCVGWPRA
jgi:hypothetical protein